jgi:hypothetical protein
VKTRAGTVSLHLTSVKRRLAVEQTNHFGETELDNGDEHWWVVIVG